MAIHHIQLGPCFTLPVAVQFTPGFGADAELREVFPTKLKPKAKPRWRGWAVARRHRRAVARRRHRPGALR